MFEMKVVKAFNKAIALEENWNPAAPRWPFIDADMYMDCCPQTPKEVEVFYRLFNDLADSHQQSHKGLNFAEYTAKMAKIEAEYLELFGAV
jgi:coenzyme F420-reducing hydrogenase gamma subunit